MEVINKKFNTHYMMAHANVIGEKGMGITITNKLVRYKMHRSIADNLDEWLSAFPRFERYEKDFREWYDTLPEDIKKHVVIEQIDQPKPLPARIILDPRPLRYVKAVYNKETKMYTISNNGVQYTLSGDWVEKLDGWVSRLPKLRREIVNYEAYFRNMSEDEKRKSNFRDNAKIQNINDGSVPEWLLPRKAEIDPFAF